MIVLRTICIVTLSLLLFASPLRCESDNASTDNYPDSLLRVIDSHTLKVGNVTIDKETRSVSFPGWINMQSGLVEYLIVTRQGKRHESVLVADIRPLHLQVALLLLGLESGGNLEAQGDSAMPSGDSVTIQVSWVTKSGKAETHAATDLIYNSVSSKPMEPTVWIFTGSTVWEKGLVADTEGSIVATYSDPAALINNPLPGRFDDTILGINSEIVPKLGTEVTIIIKGL